ncbi:alpha/beta hydrolase [Pseudanabaena sp. FACHB-2040]|uniref:alpha/beta fold hydrolase n=1 Tax=Pseudanabaena sp. FACHB-2040 TaxID=2692859 RepID=UPI001687AC22|nr:alpha/beta hydrolase [Pseudanabaena sp. FACHB-2040]MBD2258205.1 alpha/beta hydrolase [Pseudanabaena sp. FACHB-2040]
MLISPGFEQKSVVTSLGSIAYALPQTDFWSPAQPAEPTEPLVFAHGFGGGSSSYEWSKVYPAFAPRYRVLAPDLLGWGKSDHPARSYRVEDYLTTLSEFLDKTCEGPATVVASSLTAAMMVRVAIEHPERVKALILVAPAGLADFGKSTAQELFAQILRLPLVDKAIYWGAIATSDAIRSFLQERQFADPDLVSEEMVSAYVASAQQPNAEDAALAFVRGDLSFDLSLEMPKLAVPTYIIWGDQAQFVDVKTGRRLAELGPKAVRAFQVLPAMGLTPHLEFPAVVIGLIRQYLAQIEQP